MKAIRFQLRDTDNAMVKAWLEYFADCVDVEISRGDILHLVGDAIVSPANSFGFMDGGIDGAYTQYFGDQLQTSLQLHLHEEHGGELPVGQAVIVPTGDERIAHLISAPTMRLPMPVADTLNAYLAFRAAIRCVKQFNSSNAKPIESVLCPGLATLTGRMPVRRAAYQMFIAYSVEILSGPDFFGSVKRIQEIQDRMLTLA